MACKLCNDSGLFPFKNKEGKVINHAFVHCSCYQESVVGYQPIKPEDWDFPCSSDFRGWSYEQCGQQDPGYSPPTPEPMLPLPREVIYRHSDMGKKEFALLQQLARAVKDLRGKPKEAVQDKKQATHGDMIDITDRYMR